MDFATYRIETTRTLPQIGSLTLDSVHMTLGIMTELDEITDIHSHSEGSYHNRLRDEIGDAMWYLSNYCNLHNINPVIQTKSIEEGYKLPEKGSIHHAAKLQDMDKKKLAYNKDRDRAKQEFHVQGLLDNLIFKVKAYNLELEDILEKNIDKLRVRFPEKFDANLAINKNENKESEVFK